MSVQDGDSASSPLTVAFLGPEGSYSHQATAQKFPNRKTHTLQAEPSIAAVFTAVKQRRADIGVVPFENSSNGPVGFTLDLFAERNDMDSHDKDRTVLRSPKPAETSGTSDATAAISTQTAHLLSPVRVEAEIYLPVHHCLVGKPSPSASSPNPPPNPYHNLTTLYSHPQAWGQCKTFLSSAEVSHITERTDVSSTSRGAELAAADTTGRSAAISSSLAAELNGLQVLAPGIEDDPAGNKTRFLVLRASDDSSSSPSSLPPLSSTSVSRSATGQNGSSNRGTRGGPPQRLKTLLCFGLSASGFSSPGALADALAVFKARGVSLTSINTRPSGRGKWEYVFFVEVVGEEGGDGESGGRVEAACRELGSLVGWWRVLGSWEDAMGVEEG